MSSHSGKTTPEKPSITPEKSEITPEKSEITPEKSEITTEKSASTPEKSEITPEKSASTSEKSASTPAIIEITPEKPAITPEKNAGTPEKSTITPEKSKTTPEKSNAPEKSKTTPEKSNTSEKSKGTPEKSKGTPEKTSKSVKDRIKSVFTFRKSDPPVSPLLSGTTPVPDTIRSTSSSSSSSSSGSGSGVRVHTCEKFRGQTAPPLASTTTKAKAKATSTTAPASTTTKTKATSTSAPASTTIKTKATSTPAPASTTTKTKATSTPVPASTTTKTKATTTPVTPLRAQTAPAPASTTSKTKSTSTSSSSSSSGSVSGKVHSAPNTNVVQACTACGSKSVGSSPKNEKPSHKRSDSAGSGSVSSRPVVNRLPVSNVGNVVPSGKISQTGLATLYVRNDILRSCTMATQDYGRGNVIHSLGTKPDLEYTDYRPKGHTEDKDKSEEMKNIGNDFFLKGKYRVALSYYDKAIAIMPTNAAFHFNKAAAFALLWEIPDAITECVTAITKDPQYVKAHHRLAYLLIRIGHVETARLHITFPGPPASENEVKKLENLEKHVLQLTDARKRGDWASTLKEVDGAITAGADFSPLLQTCRVEALLKLCKADVASEVMSKMPPFISAHNQTKIFGMLCQAYIYHVEAQFKLANGIFDEALKSVEKGRKLEPGNTELLTLFKKINSAIKIRARGNDLYKMERYTEASVAYGDGIQLDPTIAIFFGNRAACWYMIGKFDRAVVDCTHALRYQPHYSKALCRRAAAYCKLERWSDAVRDYEVATKENPDNKEIAESLFHANAALKRSNGERVPDMTFGGDPEDVSGLEAFQTIIKSPWASVVLFHFKENKSAQVEQISQFFNTLCTRYPTVNFFKVNADENPEIALAEKVRTAPTFRIYKSGKHMKEMIFPSPEVLETSVRHYSIAGPL